MNSDICGIIATLILLIRLKVTAWNVSGKCRVQIVQMILFTCVLHRALVERVDVLEGHTASVLRVN